MALITDAATSDGKLFEDALGLSQSFFDMNSIPFPRIVHRRLGSSYGLTCLGRDGTSCVTIDVTGCAHARDATSFPGAPEDRSAAGVLAHECGHAVLNWLEHSAPHRRFRQEIDATAAAEAPITDQATRSAHELFAETFRLTVLDPDLLRVGRPMHWALLRSSGLVVPVRATWDVVLSRAPHDVIDLTRCWIGAGR